MTEKNEKTKNNLKFSWKKGRVIGGENRWTSTHPTFTAIIDQMTEDGPFEMIALFHEQYNLPETAETLPEAKRVLIEFVKEKLREQVSVFGTVKILRSDREIVEQTNELASLFYRLHDRGGSAPKGFRFDQSDHPQEKQCWEMACQAQLLLTETDPRNALENLEE